jgi:pimeloyl-ACP methyl ester carboxylesterase
VLLHGSGASLETWDELASLLCDAYRVVRFDLPGFGQSDPWPSGRTDAAGFAHRLGGELQALGLREVVLVGNSLGALVALHVAVQYPQLVRALALIDPAGFHERAPWPFRALTFEPTRTLFRLGLPRAATALSLAFAYGHPLRIRARDVARYHRALQRRSTREMLIAQFAMEPDHALTRDLLARIERPVLILWGRRDRLARVEQAAHFLSALRESRLITYPTLGHVPHEEAPERVAEDLRAFLARLERQGAFG